VVVFSRSLTRLILGVVVALWLENSPAEAHWLTAEERRWLVAQLHAEAEHKEQSGHVTGLAKRYATLKFGYCA